MDLSWLQALSPSWYFVVTLVGQAALTGWFMRGLKSDRDRIVADVAAAKSDIAELRDATSDLAQALGIQGAEMANLRSDYTQMTDLVMVTLPKVVDGAIKRAEDRASAVERRRRRES